MTLEEAYSKLGGDYKKVVGLLKSELLVKRFALKFLDDKSFELLKVSLEEKNFKEAFRAAHTLKGVCLNLCFDSLYKSSAALTEELRGEKCGENVDLLFEEVKQDYIKTISVLKEYEEATL